MNVASDEKTDGEGDSEATGQWKNMGIVEEDDEEEYDGDPNDEEVVWDPDWSNERKQQATQEREALAAVAQSAGASVSEAEKPTRKQYKKVRRVHSGRTYDQLLEEFDLSTGEWVPLGTASEPQLVRVDIDEDADLLL
jgi:hypothetical protein